MSAKTHQQIVTVALENNICVIVINLQLLLVYSYVKVIRKSVYVQL